MKAGRKVNIVKTADASTQTSITIKPGVFRTAPAQGGSTAGDYYNDKDKEEQDKLELLRNNAKEFSKLEYITEMKNIFPYMGGSIDYKQEKLWAKEWTQLTQDQKMIFMTCAGSKVNGRHIEPTEENIKKMKAMLNHLKSEWWEEYLVVIEKGKSGDNLHFHALVKTRTTKNHARAIQFAWGDTFYPWGKQKDGRLKTIKGDHEYLVKQHNKSDKKDKSKKKMVPYNEWIQEKVNYFNDSLKGSHSNKDEIVGGGISSEFFTTKFGTPSCDYYTV